MKNLNEEIETGNKEEVNIIIGMLNTSVDSMRSIINELTDIIRIEVNLAEDVEKINFEDISEDVQYIINEQITV